MVFNVHIVYCLKSCLPTFGILNKKVTINNIDCPSNNRTYFEKSCTKLLEHHADRSNYTMLIILCSIFISYNEYTTPIVYFFLCT